MKLNLKYLAPLATLALALAAPGAHAALVQPGAAGGSDIILNIWNPNSGTQGFTQDLGIQVGTWNPAQSFSLTITDPGIVAAYNSGSQNALFDIVASNTSALTFYSSSTTNNVSTLLAATGNDNFTVDSAVFQAATIFNTFATAPGNTFGGGPTGHLVSQSADGTWASTLANGAGNIAVTDTTFAPASLYFAAFSEGATSPNVSVYSGHWTLSFNGAVGAATSATIAWTPDAPPVPIPAAVWLLGSALVGLTGIGRRRRAA